MCGELMEEMCEEGGVFFQRQECVVTDFSKFKLKHLRVYERLDHFKKMLCQVQGKE
jgi:hypothetical protein